MKTLFNSFLLFLAALIWGLAFVAQSFGMEYIPPFWLNALRMLLAGFVLIPVYIVVDKKTKHESVEEKKKYDKLGLVVGLILGVILFFASSLQNFGIIGAGAGKSGFITSLYIILVPIISLFLKEKVHINVWISIVIALAGLYLLCFSGGIGSISYYDILLIICALFFSFQIIVIGKYSNKANCIKLSCFQCFSCGILSLICALIFEDITLELIKNGIIAVLYLGIMSSGVAYTLQIIGQKGLNATVASLLMSLESVFSVVFGVIILHETFLLREIIGCLLIFLAVVLSQISFKRKSSEEIPLN